MSSGKRFGDKKCHRMSKRLFPWALNFFYFHKKYLRSFKSTLKKKIMNWFAISRLIAFRIFKCTHPINLLSLSYEKVA